MTMYACDNCKEVFAPEEAGNRWEQLGERYTDGVNYALCPFCGSDEIVDAVRCDGCREYFHPDMLDDFFCADCIAEQTKWTKIKAS